MSQTTYSQTALDAFAGMLGDSGPNDSFSRANGDSVALEFGIAVTQTGTASPEKEVKRPALTTDVIVGLLAHKHTQDRGVLTGTQGLIVDEMGDVVRKGRVWVRIEETVAVGDAVFFRHAAGAGGTNLGRFRNDADTATATALPGASWVKGGTVAAGAVALLDINIP